MSTKSFLLFLRMGMLVRANRGLMNQLSEFCQQDSSCKATKISECTRDTLYANQPIQAGTARSAVQPKKKEPGSRVGRLGTVA